MPELQRFDAVIRAVRCMHDRKVAEAMRMVRELTEDADSPDMDMEAACDVVALWAR